MGSYVTEFRNIALTIPGITEEEQLDRFCEGLQPQIKLEVLKSNATTLSDAVRVALNVDSELDGMRAGASFRNGWQSSVVEETSPSPMEIGNVQSSRTYPRNQRRGGGTEKASAGHRQKDLLDGTCFICHKKDCRARFHGVDGKTTQVNNTDAVAADYGKMSKKDQEN